MAIRIDEKFLQDVQQLNKFDNDALDVLCASCFDCLQNGSYHTLTQENETLKSLVENLMSFTIQSLKYGATDGELEEKLTSLECNPYFKDKFVNLYRRSRGNISNILIRHSSNSYNRYVRLKWRFQVTIGSKYARSQFVPNIILRIQFINGLKRDFLDIECCVADIYHIYNKINDALRRSNVSNKLLKNIK